MKRDRFGIDWFEMTSRRDVVRNFETSGLMQIDQQTALVRVSYHR